MTVWREPVSTELQGVLACLGEFLDSLEQPVTIVDQQGVFVYYNRYSAAIDGVDAAQVLGQPLLQACPSLTADTSTLMRCLTQGQRFIHCHQRYETPLGQVIDYLHTALPLYGASGQIIGAIEVGRDLSHYRSLTNQVLDLSARLLEAGSQRQQGDAIITADPQMQQQLGHLDACAGADVPVLIYGETGTGKELFARRVHQRSKRAEKAWITLNCAAIPDTLLESTLFGTTRGAFTGAETRKGLFALADGGSLFLDELNSMPIELQGKLLRVLQDGRFSPLGSGREQQVNVRIIAAMNTPPWEEIRAGRLREDLFYRLNVGFIRVPPLRERRSDIAVLAAHFIRMHAADIRPDIQGISEQALQALQQHPWPGNVRMLENVIQRSLLLAPSGQPWLEKLHFLDESEVVRTSVSPVATSEIAQSADHSSPAAITPSLPAPAAPPEVASPASLPVQLAALERQLIQQAMATSAGHIGAAAELLGIPQTTLQSKLRKLGL